ncbi:MAG TPA: hypothetical protein VGI81_08160 [Tepidisphaeraceae bacterium]
MSASSRLAATDANRVRPDDGSPGRLPSERPITGTVLVHQPGHDSIIHPA